MTNFKTKLSEFNYCPHCESKTGFYLKVQVQGTTITNHNWDGTEGDNTHMYDDLRDSGGKVGYCQGCDRPVGNNDLI